MKTIIIQVKMLLLSGSYLEGNVTLSEYEALTKAFRGKDGYTAMIEPGLISGHLFTSDGISYMPRKEFDSLPKDLSGIKSVGNNSAEGENHEKAD